MASFVFRRLNGLSSSYIGLERHACPIQGEFIRYPDVYILILIWQGVKPWRKVRIRGADRGWQADSCRGPD